MALPIIIKNTTTWSWCLLHLLIFSSTQYYYCAAAVVKNTIVLSKIWKRNQFWVASRLFVDLNSERQKNNWVSVVRLLFVIRESLVVRLWFLFFEWKTNERQMNVVLLSFQWTTFDKRLTNERLEKKYRWNWKGDGCSLLSLN